MNHHGNGATALLTEAVPHLAGRRVLVVGWGKSGRAAALLARRLGASVTVNDRAMARPSNTITSALGTGGGGIDTAEMESLGIRFVGGGHPDELFLSSDLIVLSPGVDPQPHRLPALARAEAAGIPIWGEVELGARFIRSTIVAVGGTNGKSTVTTWLHRLALATGRPVFAGGNLGTPVCEGVDSPAFLDPDGIVVLEVSSFQMERVHRFRPHVALLLNVTEDHLDRYPDFTAYANAKGNAFAAQTRGDHAIVPHGDWLCAGQARRGSGLLWTFGDEAGDVGVYGDHIVDTLAPGAAWRYPVDDIRLKGRHNLTNAAAVALSARLMGCGYAAIRRELATFGGLPHRIVPVATIGGVRFIDDSKATNVAAVTAVLRGLDLPDGGRVVLIAGGRDKYGQYNALVSAMASRGRAAVLLGEAAGRMADAFDGASPPLPHQHAGSMEDAVHRAYALAKPGDVVLLAPACASFDMFKGYAHRGDTFIACVRDLAKQEAERLGTATVTVADTLPEYPDGVGH